MSSLRTAIKLRQAFNEARAIPKYENLAKRFHSIFFLATPHQGLDNESMVLRILRACSPDSRKVVNELEPNYAVIENINANFRHNCDHIHIFCFYETEPSISSSRNLVVDKNTATFPLAEQEAIPLMTDHLGTSRFPEASDSNYSLLRSHLATVVEDIDRELSNPEKRFNETRLIAAYLDVSDEEEEMALFSEAHGSCEWLLEKETFRRWRDDIPSEPRPISDLNARFRTLSTKHVKRPSSQETSRIFWLYGVPGSGKSYLAAYVVRHLMEKSACSYYFLKHTDRSKQSIGRLLRSLALQMAEQDLGIRRALLAMKNEDTLRAETNNSRALWNELFVQKIFRTEFQATQYWVIDALDEGIGAHDLIRLFETLPSHLPLKIFITSRYDSHTERLLRNISATIDRIDVENTSSDIRLYLEEHRNCLHDTPERTELLIEELVEKAHGSFLWIRFVLQQLESAWNPRAINKILTELPEDMTELYRRIVREMENKPNKDLAKAILRWTFCAARSLTIEELREAIERDINDSIPVIEGMISDVCGQLVAIERGKVRLIHDTARDFLQRHNLRSEFAVNQQYAHGRVAEVCLRYIIEHDSRQIRYGAGGHRSINTTSPLEEYAHIYFSEHVVRGPSPSSDAIDRVEEFLDTRVLHWTEWIAKRQDLDVLIRTAKNLDAWVSDDRNETTLPTRAMKFVRGWATDLIHLVTVFGKHLLSDPACIHTVIPPLCPTGSEIYKRFGSPSPAMEVVGLSEKTWADRIFSAPFHDDLTIAMACSGTSYAVGLRSGIVVLYSASTCQEILRVNHKRLVRLLEFSMLNNWILVSGSKRLSLWNSSNGDEIWSVDTPSEVLAMGFLNDDYTIVTATRSNHIITHNTSDGSIIEQISWQSKEGAKPPWKIYMSIELKLVAVVYRHERLWLLDLTNTTRPRLFGGQATVEALAFNLASKKMAIGFLDGELCLVDLSNLSKGPSISVNVEHLAVSVDGTTLIAGAPDGSIALYDFEHLTELSTLTYADEDIMSLNFSANGLQIIDIRRKEFNVWQPSALYRRKENDDSAGSQGRTSYGTALSEQHPIFSSTEASIINVLVAHHTGRYIFCGRGDGDVCVYDTARGRLLGSLYRHDDMGVTGLDWNAEKEILISCDSSCRIIAQTAQVVPVRTAAGIKQMWKATFRFERRLETPIQQILSSIDGEYILVADQLMDYLWTFQGEDAYQQVSGRAETTKKQSPSWTTDPRQRRKLFEIQPQGIHTVDWQETKFRSTHIPIRPNDRIDFETRNSGAHLLKVAESTWVAYDNNPLTRPLLWETSRSSTRDHVNVNVNGGHDSEDITEATLEHFNLVAPEMQYLLAIYRSNLIFLSHDGWICSMPVDILQQQSRGADRLHTRHFIVPHCWQSLSQPMRAVVTVNGDVVIAKGDELAIVRNGLNLSHGMGR